MVLITFRSIPSISRIISGAIYDTDVKHSEHWSCFGGVFDVTHFILAQNVQILACPATNPPLSRPF